MNVNLSNSKFFPSQFLFRSIIDSTPRRMWPVMEIQGL